MVGPSGPLLYTEKAYSLIFNSGRSQNFQSLNLLHQYVAFPQKHISPKGIRLKSFCL